MVAAIAAAIAAMIAIRGASSGSRATLGAVATLPAPAPREVPPSGSARGAANPRAVQSSVTAGTGVTAEALEHALAQALPERRDQMLIELLPQLVSHDAPAAARIAESEDPGYSREAALRVVAQHWTRRNVAAAIDWASALIDARERDTALGNVALELAVPRPQRALQVLSRRSAHPAPDAVLEGVVQQWATIDFSSAYAWVEAQPSGSEREALLERLVFVRLQQSPGDAARIANAVFIGDSRRIDAISTVAHHWGAQDPEAVREWALTLDAQAQRRALAELALLE